MCVKSKAARLTGQSGGDCECGILWVFVWGDLESLCGPDESNTKGE